MKTYYNPSGCCKLIYGYEQSLRVPSKACISSLQLPRGVPGMEEVSSVVNLVPEGGLLHLHRSYALGDVLMLVPVIRHLFRIRPDVRVTLSTRPKHAGIMSWVQWVGVKNTAWIEVSPARWDVLFNMDGLLEPDHTQPAQSVKHRVDIYCEALGLSPLNDKEEYLPLWQVETKPEGLYQEWAQSIFGDLHPVAVQWAGSTLCKTLRDPAHLVQEISRHYPTLVIGGPPVAVRGGYPCWGTSNLQGPGGSPLDAKALLGLLQHCQAAVTMDSGPLWLTHLSNTPVVALLGPTRPEERISKHPGRAAVVRLNEAVNCDPCFEQGHACGRTYPCMNPDSEWLAREVLQRLASFL